MIKALIRKISHKISGRKNQIRSYVWSLLIENVGVGFRVFGRISCLHPENISIGNDSSFNEGCILNAREKITIGNNVHLSSYTVLNAAGLSYERIGKDRTHVAKPIIIEDGVWLGSGVMVNPGVVIGKNSVIGSGAVVADNIPPNVIAVGVPAKVIKQINE